jgi:exodeoxyribonuclease V alpha subunit
MTVHQSQGSEFDDILLLLPDADNPVLSRELLYTAVTRARQGVRLWGAEAALRSALARRMARDSGLEARLWSTP